MAPRSARPGSNIANNTSTAEQVDNRLSSPTWDSSPNTMPGMLEANIRVLPRLNPDYRNVVEYGIVAGRKILCWSINHVNRHANNQLTKGTFKAPCMIRANTFVALDTALTTIRYAIAPGADEVALKDSPYEMRRPKTRATASPRRARPS